MIYDAIVVGFGPAGAAAAYELRRRGLSVLALERSRHPRHKSCGGGLSYRVHQLLEPGFQKVVQEVIDTVRFTFSGREEFVIPSRRPLAYMVMREQFDQYLADQAVQEGAELIEDEPVQAVDEHADRVEVRTKRTVYVARYAIGADGANSVVARALRSSGRPRPAFSLESEVRLPEGTSWAGREVLIEFGDIPGGYAWIFPKGRRLSIGIAGFVKRGEKPRSDYRRFVQGHKGLSKGEMGPILGYPLPLFHRSAMPLASPRLAVVGDAAQLVDPLFGEGIYYAIWSGQEAARCVARAVLRDIADLRFYDRQVRADLYPEFRSAFWMARAVYRFPHFTFRLFRKHPEVIQLYFQVLRGELSYRGMASVLQRKGWGFLLKSFWRLLRFRLNASE